MMQIIIEEDGVNINETVKRIEMPLSNENQLSQEINSLLPENIRQQIN